MAKKTAKKSVGRKSTSKKKEPTPEPSKGPRVVGEVVRVRLDSVAPNDWNPNKFTERQLASLERGLVEDGWLASNAMTVWGRDEAGLLRNTIIDAEHRWLVAKKLGMSHGPALVLHGLKREEAMALTVKLYKKHGEHDVELLAKAVREIDAGLDFDDLALSLGFDPEEVLSFLATGEVEIPGAFDSPTSAPGFGPSQPDSGVSDAPPSHVRMVQLFFSKEQHEDFVSKVQALAVVFGTKDVTTTVLEAVARASAAP